MRAYITFESIDLSSDDTHTKLTQFTNNINNYLTADIVDLFNTQSIIRNTFNSHALAQIIDLDWNITTNINTIQHSIFSNSNMFILMHRIDCIFLVYNNTKFVLYTERYDDQLIFMSAAFKGDINILHMFMEKLNLSYTIAQCNM